MGLGDTMRDIILGRRRTNLSPEEREKREAERIRRQAEALQRAAEADVAPQADTKRPQRDAAARRPVRRGAAAPATSAKALPGGSPATQTVIAPSGRVANHDWQLLRPEQFSPYFGTLDAKTLNELMDSANERLGDDTEGALLRYISPTYAVEEKLYYELGDRYYATLVVKNWPRHGFDPLRWHELFMNLPRVTMTTHYWRIDTGSAEKDLIDELRKIQLDLKEAEDGGKISETEYADLKKAESRLEEMISTVVHREATLFRVSCYIRVGADTLEELNKQIELCKDFARTQSGMVIDELPGDQRRAMIGSMPFAADPANLTFRLSTPKAQPLLPLISRDYIERDTAGRPNGVLYGIHAANLTPILMSPWHNDGTTEVTTVLGEPGSGKSFWLRTNIGRLAMTGAQLIVIDPIADFVTWFQRNDGQILSIGPDSPSHINPMERAYEQYDGQMRWEPIEDKIESLQPLLSLILGASYTDSVRGLLDVALNAWYASFDPADKRLMPDFLAFLKTMATYPNGDPLSPSQLKQRDDLYDMLRQTTLEGPQKNFFIHPTNVDLTSKRVCFNLKGATGRNQIFAMLMAVQLAINLAKRSVDRKLIVVDEVHLLFQASDQAQLIAKWMNDLVRTRRHWGTAITFATQFFDNEEGHASRAKDALLKDTGTFVLLRASEGMLKQTLALRDYFDEDLLMRGPWNLLSSGEQKAGARDAYRPMVIYRDTRPIPAFSVGLTHEIGEDDKLSGVSGAA